MKKFICLLLVLACSFAMFSCGKKGKSDVDGISKIVNESVATKIVTKVDYVPVDDEALSGVYTTSLDRATGKSQFSFRYTRYVDPSEMYPEYIKPMEGAIWYDANGEISRDSGETWEPNTVKPYLQYSLDVSAARFVSVTFSEDGTDMTAEIDPSESKRAFGTDISANGNITLEIKTDGTYLYEVTVKYTAKDTGALVTVITSYDYSEINFDFGIEIAPEEGTEEGTEEDTEGELEDETEEGTEDGTDAAE